MKRRMCKSMNSISFLLAITIMTMMALLSACGTGDAEANDAQTVEGADREVIQQVSLLQGLTYGDYKGSISAAQLKEAGDIGIGTFDGLNGELIMLNGIIYRAAYDGTIEEVSEEETIPFANTTFFDADEDIQIESIKDAEALKKVLDKKVNELGGNHFYMVRIDGSFKTMNVRSEYPQKEPYKPLADVLETDQTVFNYENIKGTVVGLYCPDYMNDLNAVGWHFHFISDDRKAGGHVLDLSADTLDVSLDVTEKFSMTLPDSKTFNDLDLSIDQSEDIKKVETGEE